MKEEIKVLGAGGSGCNTISRMIKNNLEGVRLIALNTDLQTLKKSKAPERILLGEKTTEGMGAGMDVKLGEKAARESKEKIKEVLKGSEMVFITAGMGGGTGSAALPVIAEITKEMDILTIAVVTKPFSFEGSQRKRIANSALKKLKNQVDTLLIIPNDKLLKLIDEKTKVSEAFSICDETLQQAVRGITDLINIPGIINVDFADIKKTMKDSGKALFGIGEAEGKNRAEKAAKIAINSSLLDTSVKGAKKVLFNVSGQDIKLFEVDSVAQVIRKKMSSNAEVIFGAVEDKNVKKGSIKVAVIGTGF